MNGLLAVVLGDHIRTHLVDADINEEPAGSATVEDRGDGVVDLHAVD